jgi:hypothetical protein
MQREVEKKFEAQSQSTVLNWMELSREPGVDRKNERTLNKIDEVLVLGNSNNTPKRTDTIPQGVPKG